jgi:RND family efflux transporter MFP subunit
MNRAAVRQLFVRLLVAGLILAGLFLLGWWVIQKQSPPTGPEEEPQVAPVRAEPARVARFGEWTEVTGTTQPLPGKVGRVSAAVQGNVLTVLEDEDGKTIAEGDRVKAGQVLVQLDSRIASANRDKVAANLAELEQQKKQAQLAVDLADIEVKRLEELSKGSTTVGNPQPLVSRVELEKARITLKDAESRRQALISRQESLKAELKALKAQLDFFSLRAPLTGELGQLHAMPGESMPAGTAVAEVINLDDIDVLCFVPPATVSRFSPGQPARLAAGQEPTGKVVYIAHQAQPETGNVAIKVRFPNRQRHLRANVVLQPQVLTEPLKERLSIPEVALLEDQHPVAVVVAEEVKAEGRDGKEEKGYKARKLHVVLGVRDRDRKLPLVEIIKPFLLDPREGTPVSPEGLLFVTKGAQGLRDEDPLKVETPAGERK